MSAYDQQRLASLLRRFVTEGENKRLHTLRPMRVEGRDVWFENRDDESAFRLFRTRASGQSELWHLEERVAGQVVRVGMADDWRTALDRTNRRSRRERQNSGPDPTLIGAQQRSAVQLGAVRI